MTIYLNLNPDINCKASSVRLLNGSLWYVGKMATVKETVIKHELSWLFKFVSSQLLDQWKKSQIEKMSIELRQAYLMFYHHVFTSVILK